jgi:GNAT superfamily N-acetyltransferase
MGDSIFIRSCTEKDIPALVNLMEELGYPTTHKELLIRFKKFSFLSGYGVLVAILKERIVGLVAWSQTLLFVSDKTRFHIEALVVNKQYRGKSIGKKLMLSVEKIARQHAPSIIDLTSGVRRAPEGTHTFYNGLGYKNDGPMAKIYLRKEIE